MATIARPVKEGGATTYTGKVALGFTNILATEADADLDTIYAAWNAGVDTVNVKDGAITNAKIIGAAGIPYSKLTLAGTLMNADVAAAAGIVGTKLAVGAAVNAATKTFGEPGPSLLDVVEQTLKNVIVTTRGGRVLIDLALVGIVSFASNAPAATTNALTVRLYEDGVKLREAIVTPRLGVSGAGGSSVDMPFAFVIPWDSQPAAGAHTYALRALAASNAGNAAAFWTAAYLRTVELT